MGENSSENSPVRGERAEIFRSHLSNGLTDCEVQGNAGRAVLGKKVTQPFGSVKCGSLKCLTVDSVVPTT